MVTITLYERQQKRHRCIGLSGRGQRSPGATGPSLVASRCRQHPASAKGAQWGKEKLFLPAYSGDAMLLGTLDMISCPSHILTMSIKRKF